MELVKGEFFEVSGINCSIENPSFVTAVVGAAQFRFSRPCPWVQVAPPGGRNCKPFLAFETRVSSGKSKFLLFL
jgi:hypothetical protein